MLVIPAVDVLEGKCVRLIGGRRDRKIVYFNDPVQAAKKWARGGAELVHLVDLDSAMEGGDNLHVIERVLKEVDVKVQVGGGIRSFDKARKLLDLGACRVVFGTLAFTHPEVVRQVSERFSADKVMVALDYVDERVVMRGWKVSTGLGLLRAIEKVITETGAGSVLVTSVAKDGTLSGVDFDNFSRLTKNISLPIYVAGGVSSLEDIRKLAEMGVKGVVIGRALYEGVFTLKEAIEVAKGC